MLINYTQLMFVNPNPKSWILIPALISAIFLLLYNFFRIKSKLKNDFLKNNTTSNSENKEYQLYLLFLGIILIVIEIMFEIVKVRPASA